MKGSFKLPVPEAGAQDGREVELSVDSGFVVWRYVGDAAWIQLVALADLEGAPGDSAYEVAVANGFVGTDAEWLASLEGADGDDGIPVEISVQAGWVCWRYVGELSWTQIYQVPTYTTKATGAEVTTGTDDAKFVTSKAIADSNVVQSPAAQIKTILPITNEDWTALATKESTTLYLII